MATQTVILFVYDWRARATLSEAGDRDSNQRSRGDCLEECGGEVPFKTGRRDVGVPGALIPGPLAVCHVTPDSTVEKSATL